MKKALLTLAMDGQYREMQRLTLPGKVRYAQQHGYEMVGMPPDYRHTAPLGWWKIDLMTRLLDDFDCIFYIDADMAIVDGRSDLVDEIPAAAWLGMTVHDVGPMGNVPWVGLIPNAGMMVVYRPLLPFLKAVMELAPAYGEHPWQEQGVLMLLMGFRLDFPCVRVTNTELWQHTHELNARWNWHPFAKCCGEPFIRHATGVGMEQRMAMLKTWCGIEENP